MNITQAKAVMRRLLGDKWGYRYDDKAADANERTQLKEALPALRLTKENAKQLMQDRRAELLRDPEYRRLADAWSEAQKAHDRAISRLHHRRVTILKNEGMFATQVAEGDNWQEAIDDLKAAVGKRGQKTGAETDTSKT